MRRIILGAALVALISVAGVFDQAGPANTALVSREPVSHEESWPTRVLFDFRQGISGPVRDVGGRITLYEAVAAGGSLIQMPRDDGWAVHFPARCRLDPRDCPRAILESGPADFLNPGLHNLRWGADVMLQPTETSDGGNVLQKGLSVSGTQFKLQIDGYDGRPSCVLAGEVGKFIALAPWGVADGEWHSLQCERRSSWLTLYVDGSPISERWIPPDLSIVNDSPLRLGGKGHGLYNDQFHGTLDDVFVEIA